MATSPLTEADLQSRIHKKYEKNSSTPASTSEDYLVRRSFLNDAIETYSGRAKEENIQWDELFVDLADAATGDKTTTANDATYAMPDDFVEMSSLVTVDGNFYVFKKNDDVILAQTNNSSEKFYWITGSEKTGYILHLNPTPTAAGLTIAYSYYKLPTLFTATTSTTEIKKPYFLIYDVLSVLFEEERPDISTKYAQKAKALMDQMIIQNSITPTNNSQETKNIDKQNSGFSWGE